MRLLVPLLVVMLWAGGLLGPAARAAPRTEDEPSFRGRLHDAIRALGATQRERRLSGLGRMPALIAENAGACGRAVRALADILRRRGPDEAAAAVACLARIRADRARELWLEALDGTLHPTVFRAAVRSAEARREDVVARRGLLDLARDGRAPAARRALALEALGGLGGGPSRLVLVHPVTEGDGPEPWLLASGRALGLERLGGEAAIVALLDLLSHPHAAPRVHAWEGLVALTRQGLPVDAEAWREWWADRREAAAAPPAPVTPADRYALPAPVHVPRYYGVPIPRPRSHVVFCLDVSQSMYGRGIEQARGELERTLADFPSTYAFDVVAFNENVHPFAGELWPAHPVVKARVLAWMAALETISYTNLYDAVETAFGYGGIGRRTAEHPARLDAVFLLSDGAPNRGRYRRENRVVEAIAALSRGRIPVHAVAAGEEVFPLLKRIAETTGGRFVDAFEFD